MAASKAVPKPATLKPDTKLLMSIIRNALITKVKSPKVIKFTGKVKITKIGFKNIVSKPHTIATIARDLKSAMVIPGTK